MDICNGHAYEEDWVSGGNISTTLEVRFLLSAVDKTWNSAYVNDGVRIPYCHFYHLMAAVLKSRIGIVVKLV